MSVAAENPVGVVQPGMQDRARSHFRGKPQPAGVQAIQKAREGLAFEIEFLQLQMQKRSQRAEQQIVDRKAIELVAVNGEMAAALKLPLVFLVHFHAHQVRHDVAEPAIVIALHPDHFNAALGIGEFADVAEELPVGFGQAAKVEVGKNVAQQDQAAETVLPQHPRGLLRAADL